MSFKFIDDNTLNNIANAIRYKSSTDEKILGSEFANAINNITTGSVEMSGNAFCFSGDTLYLGQNFELYNISMILLVLIIKQSTCFDKRLSFVCFIGYMLLDSLKSDL